MIGSTRQKQIPRIPPTDLRRHLSSAVREAYATRGVHSTAINECNEAVIPVESSGSSVAYTIELRVFNDGVGESDSVILRRSEARVDRGTQLSTDTEPLDGFIAIFDPQQ